MRTIPTSWKKALGFVSLLILYFAAPIFLPTCIMGGDDLVKLGGNKIHQGQEKPIFKEDGALGNYEKTEEKRTGPGEMGKPHSVKEEQKNEEERLKSKNIYFFIGNSRLGIYRNLFEPIGNRKKKHCLIYLHGVFIQL